MGLLNHGEKSAEAAKQYSATAKEIIDKVKCPCEVFLKGDSVERVMAAYKEASARGRKEGFVPILVQSDDTLAEWLGILEDESYSKEAILRQERRGGAELLQQWYSQYMEDYEEDFGDVEVPKNETLMKELMGEMEGGEELHQMISFLQFSGQGIEETILFEIPVKNPWEVIAWMPMGGWNDCPQASEMMEVCRYWYEQYGAVPAAFSHDTLEFMLEKPVEDEETAWALAKEHYGFCPDRVDQGTASGTFGEVADCIRKSTVWYFWWD